MCILFIAIKQHPDFPLIIAANRDEYFARETQSAQFWSSDPNILAGRDNQSGGTWLGVNRFGRVAAVTNLRAPELVRSDAMSRGGLVSRFLRAEESSLTFQNFLEISGGAYNPFNMLFGTVDELCVFNSLESNVVSLEEGFHCVCNGFLQDRWPKMDRGIEMVQHYISEERSLEPDALMNIMRDEALTRLEQLPDTGIDIESEQRLSSIFIPPTQLGERIYGTRSTTILMAGPKRIGFCEFEHTQGGETLPCHPFEFDREAAA